MLSAGDLDPSFGTGGEVQTSFPPNTTAGANAVAVQPDGKIVAVGNASGSTAGSGSVALVRYNPDGSLDPSFGTGGRVTTSGATGSAMALQPDAKILVAGSARLDLFRSQLFLLRYLPDGSLDPSFGAGGETTLVGAGGSSVAIQPDGKIVVAGTQFGFNTGSQVETLTRFNPDGSLDQGFGTNGVVKNFGVTEGSVSGLALQADGRILVATSISSASEITRLNLDGSLDSLFGNAGQAVVGFAVYGGPAVQPDGRIVVVGATTVANAGVFAVGRVNTNGTIDATFGTGGSVSTDFGPGTGGNAFEVALQPDGRIIVVGNAGTNNTMNSSFGLIRYNPNGSLDVTFGSGGRVTSAFGASPATAYAVALQPDGKIVAAGLARTGANSASDVFAVARYLGDTPIADANQRFVTHVYLDFLGRLPDSSGLASWTGLLNQGFSHTQVVQMIEASQEYHRDEVQYLYGFVLGRLADPLGMSIWRGFLDRGGTAEQLEFILLGTDEYFAGRGGGSNTNFLQGVYRDVLGRMIDSFGAQSWNQALAAGNSRTVVAAEILASLESDMDEVQGMYAKILRRPADSAGLSFFTQDLQQGVPNEAVLAALAGSDEYFARP